MTNEQYDERERAAREILARHFDLIGFTHSARELRSNSTMSAMGSELGAGVRAIMEALQISDESKTSASRSDALRQKIQSVREKGYPAT